ncbi:MAG: oligosaccharide flippase family protein [Deltaproteobacteria bacterium]|nr:oligosaccharide flippase family protein [Deltaproteobacteria bacterium]
MSLANKAARGALWTVVSSMGGRAVGVVGTLMMTRFLAPETIGEVADATILCMTANWLTIWGFGQYAVVKGRGDDALEVTFHATVAYVVLGILSLGLIALFGGRLTPMLNAPLAAEFVPGMALAIFIRRLSAMPERVLTRDMMFRASGMALGLGEVAYAVSALGLAALGHGGMSIVYANIVQSVVMFLILVRAAGFRSWTTPTPLRWSRFKAMLKFGVPLGIQGIANSASRYWDKLAISHFFGTGAVGTYNMAYNLADIPAIQVGEQIALVLMPSMAALPPERRPAALERTSALLSLIIFPLAIGLGLVAYPLISLLLPNNKWQEVAPLLAVLTSLSVFRPITWVLSAYLEAEGKTNRLMLLEIAKIAILLGGIWLLSPYGLRAAAAAVGIAFGFTAITGIAVVVREGVSPGRLFLGFVRPMIACVVMGAAVYITGRVLIGGGLDHPGILLPIEIVVGGVAYVAAALIVARETSIDLLRLLKGALKK